MSVAPVEPDQSDWTDAEKFYNIRTKVHSSIQNDEQLYEAVRDALARKGKHVVMTIGAFNKISPMLSRSLLLDPFLIVPPVEAALSDVAKVISSLETAWMPDSFVNIKEKEQLFKLKLGLTGWLGVHSVTPRGLSSRLANKMVCVEGIVTRCSVVHPKLVHATFYVPELERHFFREHRDAMAVQRRELAAKTLGQTEKDQDGNVGELEHGLSIYKNSQRLTLQEMPETIPAGQLPRTVEVICEHDLVDKAKPGDRVRVWGVLRTLAVRESGAVSGMARGYLLANNVEQLNREQTAPKLTATEIKQFNEIANRPDTLDLVAAAIAPSISGHEKIKRGLALQLVGGEAKTIDNDGSRLRGDIHVLLVGDPSCGKSQMLRFVMKLAPLALSTTGRGSSAVGLTAALVSDPDTGGRRLEAGAMVLADGGIVCIDEFDKMSADDRVAVHEVMEQQRVSINKAGIFATLNAQTSVLAAANPVYGLFDDSVDFSRQINFPDSLLSRFDLIYIVRESASAQQDRQISSQVLAQLRSTQDPALAGQPALTGVTGQRALTGGGAPGQRGSTALALIQPDTGGKKTRGTDRAMYTTLAVGARKQNKVLSPDFLRKFVIYCKQRRSPGLTPEASERIASFYALIRQRLQNEDKKRALPTPRLLEACIRLATAHAKLKLKLDVEVTDVIEAEKLLMYTLCGVTDYDAERAGQSRESTHTGRSGDTPTPSSRRRRSATQAFSEDEVETQFAKLSLSSQKRPRTSVGGSTGTSSATVTADQMSKLREALKAIETKYDRQEWGARELLGHVNKRVKLTEEQWTAAVEKLQRDNIVMAVGSKIYLV